MEVIVLAGGRGNRMGLLTETRPKPLLIVGGRPILEHILLSAVSAGADRFIIVVGFKHRQIRRQIGSSIGGVDIEYVLQSNPQGTADALEQAIPATNSDLFVTLMGDCLYHSKDLERMFGDQPTIGGIRVSNPSKYGVMSLSNDGTLENIIEKPKETSNSYIFTGAAVIPRSIKYELGAVPISDREEYELTHAISSLCTRNRITVTNFNNFIDITCPSDIFDANILFQKI